jgi:hypothetical protein
MLNGLVVFVSPRNIVVTNSFSQFSSFQLHILLRPGRQPLDVARAGAFLQGDGGGGGELHPEVMSRQCQRFMVLCLSLTYYAACSDVARVRQSHTYT